MAARTLLRDATLLLGAVLALSCLWPASQPSTVSASSAAGAMPASSPEPALTPLRAADQAAVQEVRTVVARSVPYLEEHGVAWIEKHGCVSCHQVPIMLWSLHAAAGRDLGVDPARLEEWTRWTLERSMGEEGDNADGISQLILSLPGLTGGAEGERADLAGQVVAEQQADGRWRARGQLPQQRRPTEESHRVASVWATLALGAAEGDAEALAKGREQVLSWRDEDGESVEWLLVQALFEQELGDAERVGPLVEELLAAQNEDGGWSWLRGEESDAFATGQSLYTLARLGRTDDAVVERARRFLLDSQRQDGSWPVRSTLRGEHGEIHTSTYWGTGWAVIGLLDTLPETETRLAYADG